MNPLFVSLAAVAIIAAYLIGITTKKKFGIKRAEAAKAALGGEVLPAHKQMVTVMVAVNDMKFTLPDEAKRTKAKLDKQAQASRDSADMYEGYARERRMTARTAETRGKQVVSLADDFSA